MTEYLSKYPMVFPLKTKSAEEIAKHLWSYISLFGPPKEILSDQGREFINQVVDVLLQRTGVDRRVTSAYHPRTNGLTERFNKTLVEALRIQAEEDPCQWAKWIDYVLLAYRSREHSSTKATPFELMFGRLMNTFEDWRAQPGEEEVAALRQRAMEIRTMFEETHVKGQANIEESQETNRKLQDEKAKDRLLVENLKVGSTVYVRPGGMKTRFQPRAIGPYTIEEVGVNNYHVISPSGKRLQVNIDRIVPVESMKDSFEVKGILDHRRGSQGLEYLVEWEGYPEEEPCWFQKPTLIRLSVSETTGRVGRSDRIQEGFGWRTNPKVKGGMSH